MNIIEKFYESFTKLDAKGMCECYHPNASFEDPAFGKLKGKDICHMWTMLCESQKGTDFKISFGDIEYSENNGSANWEAWYVFSKTGRNIHNKIHAEFLLKDGLIAEHRDHFDLYRWSRQAFGVTGFLIGWSGYFKNKLQDTTNKLLSKHKAKKESIK